MVVVPRELSVGVFSQSKGSDSLMPRLFMQRSNSPDSICYKIAVSNKVNRYTHMFFVYVNDMMEGMNSFISLFENDAKLLRKVKMKKTVSCYKGI